MRTRNKHIEPTTQTEIENDIKEQEFPNQDYKSATEFAYVFPKLSSDFLTKSIKRYSLVPYFFFVFCFFLSTPSTHMHKQTKQPNKWKGYGSDIPDLGETANLNREKLKKNDPILYFLKHIVKCCQSGHGLDIYHVLSFYRMHDKAFEPLTHHPFKMIGWNIGIKRWGIYYDKLIVAVIIALLQVVGMSGLFVPFFFCIFLFVFF